MKQEQQAGEVIDFAGDGKFDSMGKAWNTFHQMQLQFNKETIISGFSAAFCTYVIQELKDKRIVAVWVAHKYMVNFVKLIIDQNTHIYFIDQL